MTLRQLFHAWCIQCDMQTYVEAENEKDAAAKLNLLGWSVHAESIQGKMRYESELCPFCYFYAKDETLNADLAKVHEHLDECAANELDASKEWAESYAWASLPRRPLQAVDLMEVAEEENPDDAPPEPKYDEDGKLKETP